MQEIGNQKVAQNPFAVLTVRQSFYNAHSVIILAGFCLVLNRSCSNTRVKHLVFPGEIGDAWPMLAGHIQHLGFSDLGCGRAIS